MSFSLAEYLPPHGGLLPKWLLLVSLVSILNSAQAYTTLHYTQRVYEGPRSPPKSAKTVPTAPVSATAYPASVTSPVTALSARTFGTWTFLSSVIRLYAAYNIDNPIVYQLALCTYSVAFVHFYSEWLYFRTARWGPGLAAPVMVATGSLVWMLTQWSSYVQ